MEQPKKYFYTTEEERLELLDSNKETVIVEEFNHLDEGRGLILQYFDFKADKISKVKKIAADKINTVMSDAQQRNSLFTLHKHGKKAKAALSSVDKAEISDIEAKWSHIEDIRTASNLIETEIKNLEKVEETQKYDILNSPLWSKS